MPFSGFTAYPNEYLRILVSYYLVPIRNYRSVFNPSLYLSSALLFKMDDNVGRLTFTLFH